MRKIYLEELARIQEQLNTLMEQALGRLGFAGEANPPGAWAPAVDVLETDDEYLLYAELPGVRREDIQLEVREGRLELTGRLEPLAESQHFLRMERSYGPFRRVFPLGGPVDADKIEASLARGVLEIVVPKKKSRRGKGAIRIQEES